MFRVLLFLLALLTALPAAQPALAVPGDADDWQVMPAGARPTYIGIHGGTVPVSLLINQDGTALVSFVGRTGNDFLEILHRTDIRMPSLLNNATSRVSNKQPSTTLLLTSNADRSMLVFYIVGDGASRTNVPMSELVPFGLSATPLYVEGNISLPAQPSPDRLYRLNLDPQYLQPRRSDG